MKALSIRQPWAWLLASGQKDIENRTWKTNFRGRFLIHASKSRSESLWLKNSLQTDLQDAQILYGGIIGIAEIVDCVASSASPWFEGPYGFVIHNAQVLAFFPCRGSLGFFEVAYPFEL